MTYQGEEESPRPQLQDKRAVFAVGLAKTS